MLVHLSTRPFPMHTKIIGKKHMLQSAHVLSRQAKKQVSPELVPQEPSLLFSVHLGSPDSLTVPIFLCAGMSVLDGVFLF